MIDLPKWYLLKCRVRHWFRYKLLRRSVRSKMLRARKRAAPWRDWTNTYQNVDADGADGMMRRAICRAQWVKPLLPAEEGRISE
jgi:hypothetical protein